MFAEKTYPGLFFMMQHNLQLLWTYWHLRFSFCLTPWQRWVVNIFRDRRRSVKTPICLGWFTWSADIDVWRNTPDGSRCCIQSFKEKIFYLTLTDSLQSRCFKSLVKMHYYNPRACEGCRCTQESCNETCDANAAALELRLYLVVISAVGASARFCGCVGFWARCGFRCF